MKISFFDSNGLILVGVLIGAVLGAALGYFSQCTSGTCPLTSTWWRGAIYGGVIGLLFGSSANSKRQPGDQFESPSYPRSEHPKVTDTTKNPDAEK